MNNTFILAARFRCKSELKLVSLNRLKICLHQPLLNKIWFGEIFPNSAGRLRKKPVLKNVFLHIGNLKVTQIFMEIFLRDSIDSLGQQKYGIVWNHNSLFSGYQVWVIGYFPK